MPQRPPLLQAEYLPRFEWRFLMPRYWGVWILLGVLIILMWLPWSIRRGLADWIGTRIFARHRKRRRIVDINLAWCFPQLSEAERAGMAEDYFRSAARILLDFGLLWFGSPKRLERSIVMHNAHHLEQARGDEQPVILLTCHNLALEFGALITSRRHEIVGLIKAARNPLFEWLVARGRTRFMCRLIERDAGIRHIVKAVKMGIIFYYLPDEDLGQTQQTAFLPFFGVQTSTLTSLGRLARLCNARVVPCYTRLDGESGKYILEFFPPLEDFPSADELADATRMNQTLEALIRTAPEQYMWSFRIFQTRPANEPCPYNEPE
ncbi:MAG: lipid A biosynthesis acyltransferase [Gammaproteobacteria bacterium]|nr:lipid A biosynthesis acyltransferase [Gammaproteobacteria bacterium]MDH5650664.1 lipid A biosynthesis acyltransferase [Gammaproteobacteria bacterium]